MPARPLKSPFNPFYALVVVLGIAFCITATAYGVMTFRALRGRGDDAQRAPALIEFLNRHGERLLIGEVILLGLATFGAIKTDRYWQDRSRS